MTGVMIDFLVDSSISTFRERFIFLTMWAFYLSHSLSPYIFVTCSLLFFLNLFTMRSGPDTKDMMHHAKAKISCSPRNLQCRASTTKEMVFEVRKMKEEVRSEEVVLDIFNIQ